MRNPFRRKKPWEKVACVFIVQEHPAGSKGWRDITEPTGSPPTIDQAREHMAPGCHYRLMSRYIDGEQAGTYAGLVWSHYEPHKGIKPAPKAKERKAPPAPKPMDPVEAMDAYADQVGRVLTPLVKIGEVMEQIRGSLGGGQGQQGQPAQPGLDVPPLEYDGKAPWFMHPYVAKTFADQMMRVIDYGATRAKEIIRPSEPVGMVEEEEEPLLPPIPVTEPVVEEVEEPIEVEGGVPGLEELEEAGLVEVPEPVIVEPEAEVTEEPVEEKVEEEVPAEEEKPEAPVEEEPVEEKAEEEAEVEQESQEEEAEEAEESESS